MNINGKWQVYKYILAQELSVEAPAGTTDEEIEAILEIHKITFYAGGAAALNIAAEDNGSIAELMIDLAAGVGSYGANMQ